MAKTTSKNSCMSGTLNSDKKDRLARALRANLLKRKSQTRSRAELKKDIHKEKKDG